MTEGTSEALGAWIWRTAAASPDSVIIRDAERVWTWRELLSRADGYAAALRALGHATPVVPLLAGRNGDTVAALLGCFLAGRAFAPLSPDQPTERLHSCFQRLAASAYVSTLDDAPPAAAAGLVRVEPLKAESDALPAEPEYRPDALLYVLFTSGSTGVPKGVLVSQDNLANTMAWSADVLPWQDDDVIGLAVNFFFDISMFDVFSALCFGVPLAILSRPADMHGTADEIAAHGVTSIFSAPALFSQYLRAGLPTDPRLRSLRRIVSGGDFFPPTHVLGWLEARPDVEVFNVWGPTETSIVNTMHRVGPADLADLRRGLHAPVGSSHPRMPLVVVDGDLRPVPSGTEGEVCMLGRCVTQGYLGDPEQTAAAYVSIDGERAYRTRDLGFIGPDGLLRITGRMGFLVKVGGYRIDVREVETAASRQPGVHHACAFVRELDDGIQELWLAFETDAANGRPDIFAIKNGLRRTLPAYMVPKRLIVVPELPHTPNRKLDRKAVPAAALATLVPPQAVS